MSIEPTAPDSELTTSEARQLGINIATDTGPRRVRLIRPRRWQKFQPRIGAPFLTCPYCCCVVPSEEHADEHLWRWHAGNRRDFAGAFDLVPWLTELQRQVDHLEEDVADPAGNGLERVWKDQGHEARNRRRRRTFKQWCKFPSAPQEDWQQ